MDGRGSMNKRNRHLLTFAFVFVLVSLINTPASVFAIGEYDGLWVGPETITLPGYGSLTETTGTIIYQEEQNELYFFDSLFGTIQLIKSNNQWILPSPIWTTFEGYQAYLTEVSITFHSSSYLTGSITVMIEGVTGTGSLSHNKSTCQNLTNGTTLSGISGSEDSLRCYEVDLPSGSTDLTVQTWGGSGDSDLYLIYHRPNFDFYSSENWENQEEITLPSPDPGKWYIVLYGFESYSGLSLRASYVGIPAPLANFDADALTGHAPLTVNFIDQSTGSITSWVWDFGDDSTSTQQNPSHTYTDPGTYTVTLTATGPGGSDTETKTDYIEISNAVKAMPWIPLLLLDD